MVFQSFNLFPHFTVLENIMKAPMVVKGIPRAQALTDACHLLEKVSLTEKTHYYPFGLSGGQQQRVAIARALAMAPRVMLYDEPTSALDTALVAGLLDLMRELRREGMTQLIVTHDTGFARKIADRVILFEKGRIIESGPPRLVPGMGESRKELL